MQVTLSTKNKARPRTLFNWEPNEDDSKNLEKFDAVIIHDAFPRQGNTFLSTSLNRAFPQESVAVVGLTHTPELLSYSLKNSETVTSTRNPIDCLTSWLLKCNYEKSIEKRKNSGKVDADPYVIGEINKYTATATAILERKDKHNLTVVPFDFLINNVDLLVDYVAKKINVTSYNRFNSEEILFQINERFKFHKETASEAWSMHGYVPRDRPEIHKEIKSILSSDLYVKELSNALEVHNRLVSISPFL